MRKKNFCESESEDTPTNQPTRIWIQTSQNFPEIGLIQTFAFNNLCKINLIEKKASSFAL